MEQNKKTHAATSKFLIYSYNDNGIGEASLRFDDPNHTLLVAAFLDTIGVYYDLIPIDFMEVK